MFGTFCVETISNIRLLVMPILSQHMDLIFHDLPTAESGDRFYHFNRGSVGRPGDRIGYASFPMGTHGGLGSQRFLKNCFVGGLTIMTYRSVLSFHT